MLQKLEAVKKRAAEMIAEAERPYQQAVQDRSNACAQHDRVIATLEYDLCRTASPSIDKFAEELEQIRRSLTLSEQIGTTANGRQIVTHSNAPSMQRAAVRIAEILCRELPRLKLEPLTDDELAEALQALRESVPKVVVEKLH